MEGASEKTRHEELNRTHLDFKVRGLLSRETKEESICHQRIVGTRKALGLFYKMKE